MKIKKKREIASFENTIGLFAMTIGNMSLRVLLPALLMRSNLVFKREIASFENTIGLFAMTIGNMSLRALLPALLMRSNLKNLKLMNNSMWRQI